MANLAQRFLDHFDNATVDLDASAGNGSITEPAGTTLQVGCSAGQNCNGWDGTTAPFATKLLDAITIPDMNLGLLIAEATADAEPVRALEASLDAPMDPALVDLPEQERARMHHPGLTEPVATFGRSPVVTLVLCVLLGAFIAAAITFVTPADTVSVAQQVLV